MPTKRTIWKIWLPGRCPKCGAQLRTEAQIFHVRTTMTKEKAVKEDVEDAP